MDMPHISYILHAYYTHTTTHIAHFPHLQSEVSAVTTIHYILLYQLLYPQSTYQVVPVDL